jgi:uncharacterized integral membrane protein (TIGR00698 family)
MMLAPFLLVLSARLARGREQRGRAAAAPSCAPIAVPWFAVLFIVVVGLHSTGLLPKAMASVASEVDTFVLATAMGALGLTTRMSAIRAAGAKPLVLALVLFGWLVFGGFAINVGVVRLLG